MPSPRDKTKGSVERLNDHRPSTAVASGISAPAVATLQSPASRTTIPRTKRLFTRKDSTGFLSSFPSSIQPATTPITNEASATPMVPKLPPRPSSQGYSQTVRNMPSNPDAPSAVIVSVGPSPAMHPNERSPRRPTLLNIFQHTNSDPKPLKPSKSKEPVQTPPSPPIHLRSFGLRSKKNKTASSPTLQETRLNADNQLYASPSRPRFMDNKASDRDGKSTSSGFQFPRPRLGSRARELSPPPPVQQVRAGSPIIDSVPSTPSSSPKKSITTFGGLRLKKSGSSFGLSKRRSLSLCDMTSLMNEVGVISTENVPDVPRASSIGSRLSQDKSLRRGCGSSSDLNSQVIPSNWSTYSVAPPTPTSVGMQTGAEPIISRKIGLTPPRHPASSATQGSSPLRPGHQHQFSTSAKMQELGRRGWDKMERLLGGIDVLPRSNPGDGLSISPGSRFYKTHTTTQSESTSTLNRESTAILASAVSSSGPKLPPLLRPPRPEGGGLLFGKTLASAVANTKIEDYPGAEKWLDSKGEQRGVACPALIVRCIQHLETWGIQEEGLFRITGRSTHVNKLRSEFDAGGDYDLRKASPGDLDPHSVCSVLKAYFRELPEPILTRSLARSFDDALMGNSDNVSLNPSSMRDATGELIFELQSLVTRLPPENFSVLRELCRLLKKTSDHHAVNKMTLSNLILIFCPSLNMNPSLLRVIVEVHEDIFSLPSSSRTATISKFSKALRPIEGVLYQPSASDLKLASAMSSTTIINQPQIVTPIIHRMPSIPRLRNSPSGSQLRHKHSHNISLPLPSLSQPSTNAENVLTFPHSPLAEGSPQRTRTGSIRALGNLFLPRSRSDTLRSPDSESAGSNSRLSSFFSPTASSNGDETDDLPKASGNPRRRSDTAPHISLQLSTAGLTISPSSSPTASHRASWSEPVLPLPPAVDRLTAQVATASADTGGSKTPIADLFRVDMSVHRKPFRGTVVASSGSGNSAATSSSSNSTTNRSGFSSSMVETPIVAQILDNKRSEIAVIGRGGAKDAQTPNSNSEAGPETGFDPSTSLARWESGAPRLSVQRRSKNSTNEDWATSVLIAAQVEPRLERKE